MTLRGRKCSACGARMPANMKYCGMCGHKLDPDDTANIPPVVSSQLVDELLGGEVKASPEEKKEQNVTVDSLGRNFLIGAAAAAALVVVIAAAVLIVHMNRPVSQEDSQEAIEAVHVISGAANTEPTPEVTATPKPTPSDRTDSPLAKTAMAQQNPGPTATPKPEGDPVYVIPYGLNLRDGPGTGYDIVDSAVRGEELWRLDISGDWTRVSHNGREGYVMSSLITDAAPDETPVPEEAEPTAEPTATPEPTPEPTEVPKVPAGRQDDSRGIAVTRYGVNVRSGPGTEYSVVDSLLNDEQVRITGYTDGWYRVEYYSGTGYISESVLDIIQEPAPLHDVTPSPEPEIETFPILVEGKANIRTGPGTQYDILGAVEAGDVLDATQRMGGWYIILYNGQEGYVPANLAIPAE